LRQALERHRDDPRLVAVGEIGLDHFVPGLDLARQAHFYAAQLDLARQAGLPVILHVRRSADALLQQLRRVPVIGGIAHAFNGSAQQARSLSRLGFKLGFGGALTFDRALQIRRLASELARARPGAGNRRARHPAALAVPHRGAARGGVRSRNEPAELPRIGAVLAALRGWTLQQCAAITCANVRQALPRLQAP
jgi:TatD DNase family protein